MNPTLFFENFDLLADSPKSIQKLRELILQLAVMGKLVPHDPNDEPASVLLEKIKAENRIRSKNSETFLPIKKDEIPFEAPVKWALCRLGEIIQLSSGDALPSHKMNTDGKIPIYGGNGITGYHSQNNVGKPTIVIGRVGFYCGSVHITPNLAWITDNAFNTYFSESNLDLNFLYWLLKSANLGKRNNSTAQPVISGKKVYPTV